jgi:hypothetical protein
MKKRTFNNPVRIFVFALVALTMLVGAQEAKAQMRAGFDSSTLPANDDGSTGLVNIGFNLDYFGSSFTQLFVNNNGNLTFGSSFGVFTPTGLTGATGIRAIAPFWADVDTTGVGSGLTKYGTGTVDRGTLATPNVRPAFGATWRDVGYFSSQTNKLNTFQAVLIDRSDLGNCFEMEFNYEKIQWETGAASGGSNGLGGSSAVAGYSAGSGVPGTFFQLAGSGVNGGLLDSNLGTGLINTSNIDFNGRYRFLVHEGNVIGTVAPEPGTLALIAIGGAGFVTRLRRRKR